MKLQERYYYKNDYQEIENLIRESKNRIQKEIKKGFKFHHLTYALSNHILRNHISQRVSMVVMFVDLVDSTKISARRIFSSYICN